MGALVKSVGQPCAGNPHARLEEGAPVRTPEALPDRALLYSHTGPCHQDEARGLLQIVFQATADLLPNEQT